MQSLALMDLGKRNQTFNEGGELWKWKTMSSLIVGFQQFRKDSVLAKVFAERWTVLSDCRFFRITCPWSALQVKYKAKWKISFSKIFLEKIASLVVIFRKAYPGFVIWWFPWRFAFTFELTARKTHFFPNRGKSWHNWPKKVFLHIFFGMVTQRRLFYNFLKHVAVCECHVTKN